ncbi:hypothetical protein E4T39_00189 [Aureobasidium subglaciale]|nr:hypothetical protein E4T39_00189 [Aureobasidium subglaciale]
MESDHATPLHRQTSPPPHESEGEELVDPKDELSPFDWQALDAEYLQTMAQCKANEDKQLEDFASLSQFFGVWAETISGHEQKRSHARLRTQSALAMHNEVELEKRRKHYVKVVEAFRKALLMLDL